MDPLFRVEADPKTTSENGSLKNGQFRVYKKGKQVLRAENVHFGSRNGVIRGGLSHIERRRDFYEAP